jgi:23S rRNA (adenine2503-C2)-methyltransferase
MQALYGKTLVELEEICQHLSFPSYTAKQIAQWLYYHHISQIDQMSNLSRVTRQRLKENFTIGLSSPVKVQISKDGTKKYLFETNEQRFIETAYIPDKDRVTLCISSQVGCKMGCLFCMTGKQGFQANLNANEILNQIRSIPEFHELTNIVFMGMGEPLDNIDNLMKSLEILTSEWGYAWSSKRITVSSIGLLPALKTFLDNSRCHLAISLHSPFDEERRHLMPIQKVYPINEIIQLLRTYDWSGQRRLSFEYIMLKGLNDSLAHAKALLKLLNGLNCRLNLIRFHSFDDTQLESSTDETMHLFKDYLNSKNLLTTIRASRGQDISAACGLLSTKELIQQENRKDSTSG